MYRRLPSGLIVPGRGPVPVSMVPTTLCVFASTTVTSLGCVLGSPSDGRAKCPGPPAIGSRYANRPSGAITVLCPMPSV